MVITALGADPKFPGQPSINAALKQLTQAQGKIATDPTEAAEHLRKASGSLEHAVHNKGLALPTAIRLTKQAINHIEKGNVETATREIKEAIKSANLAGDIGDR
jgi:hypothetical protein